MKNLLAMLAVIIAVAACGAQPIDSTLKNDYVTIHDQKVNNLKQFPTVQVLKVVHDIKLPSYTITFNCKTGMMKTNVSGEYFPVVKGSATVLFHKHCEGV